jgi:phage baseplate assembly protein W
MSTTLSTRSSRPTLQRYFVGFSTQNSAVTGIRTFYDIDLINIDLMQSFQTRIGERVMRPDWGCKLWDYLMEPWTQTLSDQIITEVVRICRLDSRLTVLNVQAFQQGYGFRIEVQLQYAPWNVIDTFTTSFTQDDLIYFDSSPTANSLIG